MSHTQLLGKSNHKTATRQHQHRMVHCKTQTVFIIQYHHITLAAPTMNFDKIQRYRNVRCPIIHSWITYVHCVSKKVPTLILSVTLSNFNRFSHFLHCWKAYEICYNTVRHQPPHLRRVATLPWEIKNSNFWLPVNCVCVPQRFQQLINTVLCPAFLRKFVCQPLCCVPLQIQTLFMKIVSSSLNTMLIVVLLTNTAVTSAVTNFWCYKLIAKVNNQKNSDMKNFICNQYGKRDPIFEHRKYQNLATNNKVRGDQNAVCLHFLRYRLNIYRNVNF